LEYLQFGLGTELGLHSHVEARIQLQGKEMKQILKPELVLIGEVEGRVVGFALALPDINQALKPAGEN
jgi:hypothetical protein